MTKPIDIRIKESIYRTPGHWKGQATYKEQGLPLAFFKLSERLLLSLGKETIRMGNRLSKHYLKSLQEIYAPDYQRQFDLLSI